MANTKPFVHVACFCEHLLEDKDGVLSPIRVIDTMYVEGPIPPLPPGSPADAEPAAMVSGLISLKPGDVTGPRKIQLVLRRPGSEPKNLHPNGGWEVDFKGEERGVNLKMNFPMGIQVFGLCWFDVLCNGELLTS